MYHKEKPLGAKIIDVFIGISFLVGVVMFILVFGQTILELTGGF